MKKDYSLSAIILSTVFGICTLGINILYLKRCVTLYSVGIAVSALMIAVDIICLVLRIKKQDSEARLCKILMLISMISALIGLAIPVIGTLVLMFK